MRIHCLFRVAAFAAAVCVTAGCGAIRTSAIKSVAGTLSEGGTTFTSHNDPELIEGALPFALTLYESLLDSVPTYEPLLTATCAAYTQYAYGFVQVHAEETQFDDFEKSKHFTERALSLSLRARDYCWRGLEARFRGIAPKLKRDPAAALAGAEKSQVPLLYWSAASLGAAISLGGVDHPELLIDWPVVRALGERALALNDAWGSGAIHELLMTVDSQGDALGGSEERARQHFARAVEIQQGRSPSPYVGLALGLVKSKQDRKEFEQLLERALAIDPEKNPDNRLVTLIMQKRARFFLDHINDLFLEDD
ncbi:MAG TPA: TRAP transporter TatT component family protein [Vicinamibacterales bacterium]